METRAVPPFLFAYLGRRNARFIRNQAGILPLTSYLCVYPYRDDSVSLQKLAVILNHPETISNLQWVGKSYGSGALKVEPRALERLALPDSLVAASGLQPTQRNVQLPLRFFEAQNRYKTQND